MTPYPRKGKKGPGWACRQRRWWKRWNPEVLIRLENKACTGDHNNNNKIGEFLQIFNLRPCAPLYLMYRVVTATSRLKVNTRQGRSWKNDRYRLEFFQQCVKNVARCICRKLWKLNFHRRSEFKFWISWWYWFHCLPCKRDRKYDKM